MAFNKVYFFKVSFLIYILIVIGCVGENIEEKTSNGSLGTVSIEKYSDSIYEVLKAHRTAYAKLIINRLAVENKIIKVSESWKKDKSLLLPAQMSKEIAHFLRAADVDIDYSLLSTWPINRNNKPKTDAEKKGTGSPLLVQL